MSEPNWEDISRRLREPFDPSDVDFRSQGRASEQTGKAQVVAYIDARAVQDRLDDVVGAGNWAFDWTPVVVDKGEVMVAKGTLTIHGVAKSDAGSASNFEQSLGAVSHCFKRTAVHWGVGRYLYSLPMNWVPVEKNGRIADATLRDLRNRLPRPSAQSAAHAATPTQQPAQQPAQPRELVPSLTQVAQSPQLASPGDPLASEQQLASISKLRNALGIDAQPGALTSSEARAMIAALNDQYRKHVHTATPPPTPSTTLAPASLSMTDMTTLAAEVASETEQARLVKAFRDKGMKTRPQVSGFVAAHITRDLDIEALAKYTSDITNGEVRTLTQALDAIRAPRQIAAAAAQAKPVTAARA